MECSFILNKLYSPGALAMWRVTCAVVYSCVIMLSHVFAGMPAKRNIVSYDCCPEQYIDVTFTIKIRRRKLYYIFNLVVPCLFLDLLSLLVFAMPPDAGEKITCGRFQNFLCSIFMHLTSSLF